MRTPIAAALVLAAMFGVGLALIMVGCGIGTRPAALVAGLMLCTAAVSLLKASRP